MDLVRVGIIGISSVVLGILGGFAARSIIAGILLTVGVFGGWLLWRLFKVQNPESPKKDD